jgi:hypothetical protein
LQERLLTRENSMLLLRNMKKNEKNLTLIAILDIVAVRGDSHNVSESYSVLWHPLRRWGSPLLMDTLPPMINVLCPPKRNP